MYRIGIIGTENSHALAFAKLLNLPDPRTGELRHPNARVTAVFADHMETAQVILDTCEVEHLVEEPEGFFGKVDAMIITNRKGSLHAEYAMPFVERGIPVFVDKPFTSDVAEAEALVEAARASGTKLLGGSGVKLAYDVLMLQNSARQAIEAGELVGAAMNFAADTSSEYDGFYFYSPHLTEAALAVFGYDVKAVQAFEKNNSRVAVWFYEGFDISLHYTKGTRESTAVLYTTARNVVRTLDISMIYAHEVERFVEMLETGVMPQSYEELVAPVRMIAAIEESVASGERVVL